MSAMVLGWIVTVMSAFIFHKYYTFKSSSRGIKLFMEFIRFMTTYVVVFVLSMILLPTFVEIFNMPPKIAGAIVIFMMTIVSYLGHSKFSFKRKPK
jgi:putative flippase GtrA